MSEERVLLTPAAAMARLKLNSEGEVHTFVQSGPMLLGADWGVSEVKEAFESAKEVGLSGPDATKMKHGVYCIEANGRVVFFETRENK